MITGGIPSSSTSKITPSSLSAPAKSPFAKPKHFSKQEPKSPSSHPSTFATSPGSPSSSSIANFAPATSPARCSSSPLPTIASPTTASPSPPKAEASLPTSPIPPKSVVSSCLRALTKVTCRSPSPPADAIRVLAPSYAASSNSSSRPKSDRDLCLIDICQIFLAVQAAKNVCGRLPVLTKRGKAFLGDFLREIEFAE